MTEKQQIRIWQCASGYLLLLLAVGIAAAFLSCQRLTIAPKPVVAHTVAFSGNEQNAGIVDCDQNGCLVDENWLDKYQKLEATFEQQILADKSIKPEGKYFRVSYESINHWAEMRAAERGP